MYVPVAEKNTLKLLSEFDYETHVVHTHSQYYIDVNSIVVKYMWQTCPLPYVSVNAFSCLNMSGIFSTYVTVIILLKHINHNLPPLLKMQI